jgi:hypothetical protein
VHDLDYEWKVYIEGFFRETRFLPQRAHFWATNYYEGKAYGDVVGGTRKVSCSAIGGSNGFENKVN